MLATHLSPLEPVHSRHDSCLRLIAEVTLALALALPLHSQALQGSTEKMCLSFL